MSYSKNDLMRVLTEGFSEANISSKYSFKGNDAIPEQVDSDPALERVFVHTAVLHNGTPLVAAAVFTGDLEDPHARQETWSNLEQQVDHQIKSLQFYERNATQSAPEKREAVRATHSVLHRQIDQAVDELRGEMDKNNTLNLHQVMEYVSEISSAIEDDKVMESFDRQVEQLLDGALAGVAEEIVELGVAHGVPAFYQAGRYIPLPLVSDDYLERATALTSKALEERKKSRARIDEIMRESKKSHPAETKTQQEKPVNS